MHIREKKLRRSSLALKEFHSWSKIFLYNCLENILAGNGSVDT